MPLDKTALFEAWAAHLAARRVALHAGQSQARSGTRVDGEHRPENRGERAAVTSQGYLAHGLAQRVAEIDAAIDLLGRMEPAPRKAVVLGAVIEVEGEDGELTRYAVLPGGQGDVLDVLGVTVTVVSPQSPVVRAVHGLEIGEVGEVTRGGATVEVELIRVD